MGAVELWLMTCLLVGFHCSFSDRKDCQDGFYGISCDKRCPSTCPDNLCHRFNVSCKKECHKGMYGKKCDKQCSCSGPCHWRTGKCIGNSSEKTVVSSTDHQSQTHMPTDETTHPALTADETMPRCSETECWIEFNGFPVCHYECANGTCRTACVQRGARNHTQFERQVTSWKPNVSRLHWEDCSEICMSYTIRCSNESNVDDRLKIQYVEACSENSSIYCRNLSEHDTGPCDQLSTTCVDECVPDYLGTLCDGICDQGRESDTDTTPPRGDRPNIIIIAIIVMISIVITASCILLSICCFSLKTPNRPSAFSPPQPAAPDVDDVVTVADDRDGDADDGLREMGDRVASLPLSAGYLSAIHHANRDTENGGYAVPDNLWEISGKHRPPTYTSYISPVHSAIYSEVGDGRTWPVDHRLLLGDYQPRPVNDNHTFDLSSTGAGDSNPYEAHNSTGNARNPPQEHYESLNRLQHIDPNRLYSFLEIADEETNI